MKIWKVGDKAKHSGVECTVMAIHVRSAAIQYTVTSELEIVPLIDLRPEFSDEDEKVIENIFQIIYSEHDYRSAAEVLYLEGYRKHRGTQVGYDV